MPKSQNRVTLNARRKLISPGQVFHATQGNKANAFKRCKNEVSNKQHKDRQRARLYVPKNSQARERHMEGSKEIHSKVLSVIPTVKKAHTHFSANPRKQGVR